MKSVALGARRSIVLLLLGAGLILAGVSLFQTLLPLRASREAFSTSFIGILGTTYFAGFAIGCIVGPGLVRVVGHIRAFAGIAALLAALVLVFPLLIAPTSWAVLRFLTGACLAISFMVIESWLNDTVSNEVRGSILSIYIIVANVATMAGQLAINVAPIDGPVLFMIVTGLVSLSVVPLALTPIDEPTPIPVARLDLRGLFAVSPVGTVGCLLVGAAEGAFWTLGPLFGQLRGMSTAEVTLLMAAFVLGGTISQWPLGRISDFRDRRVVILLTALGTIVTGLLIAFWPFTGFATMIAIAVAHGALMIPLYALCLAHANDHVPNERLVPVSSGLLLAYAVGAAVGPIVAAPFMSEDRSGSLFIFISVVLALLSLFIAARLIWGVERERSDPGSFVPVPKTSQSVYELEVDDSEEQKSDEL